MTETLIQGTDEWRKARLGKVTASRVADIMRRTKNGASAMRANYMAELIAERLTGVPTENYVTGAMQWGIDKEPQARADYELYRGVSVECVGFIQHPSISYAGASPDGFVGKDRLVQFKCPNTATHIATLRGGNLEPDYVKQVNWEMACCPGRIECDYVSYDPRLPIEMQMVIIPVPRDDVLVRELETEVKKFNAELEAAIADLQARYAPTVNMLAGG